MITQWQPFKKKGGFVITIIGRQESGKTPLIKWLINKFSFKNKVALDFQYEYSPDEFRIYRNSDSFKNYILTCEKHFIIAEEATVFIGSQKNLDWAKLCIDIAHHNNVCVFVFHSLMDAPKSILNKSKYIYLFNTLDDEKDVKSSRNRFYKAFMNKQKPVLINNYKL